jgi:hypothetical protein
MALESCACFAKYRGRARSVIIGASPFLPTPRISSYDSRHLSMGAGNEIVNLRMLIHKASCVVDLVVDHQVKVFLAGVPGYLLVGELLRHPGIYVSAALIIGGISSDDIREGLDEPKKLWQYQGG